MSQRISGFAQLCFPRFEHGNGIAQQSIEFGERAQPRKYSRHRTERGGLGVGKRVDRVPNALHEGRCVGKPSVLRLDRLPFAGRKRKPRQLFELPTELLPFRIACRRIVLVVESRTTKSLPFAVSATRFLSKRSKPGVRVEYHALVLGPEKRLVRMLAVDVDEPISRLAHLVDRRVVAVDECA